MNNKVLLVYRDLDETEPYVKALEFAGLNPLPGEAEPGLSLNGCSGLLLMGGGDVNPALYGEPRDEQTEPADDTRDAAESGIIEEALAANLPLLAICRGLQILNVQQGGSLIQHLDGTARHRKRTADRGLPAHRIAIEPDTLLDSIAGGGDAYPKMWEVNSRHHQAISRLGTGLRINARDPEDGTIEGIEHPGYRFVLAVQWHPENQVPGDANQAKLFESFAAAVAGR